MKLPKTRTQSRISQIAAKIFVEEGIENYTQAKLKAAERLGMSHINKLPSDDDVSNAIEEYHRIFRLNTHACHLRKMRQLAFDWMEIFKPFRPRLTGAVLEGTAGPHSPITLLIFLETAEDLIIELIDANIRYSENHHNIFDGNGKPIELPAIDFIDDETLIQLKLYPRGQKSVRSIQHQLLPFSADIHQVGKLLN